jgi:hypothetical protein
MVPPVSLGPNRSHRIPGALFVAAEATTGVNDAWSHKNKHPKKKRTRMGLFFSKPAPKPVPAAPRAATQMRRPSYRITSTPAFGPQAAVVNTSSGPQAVVVATSAGPQAAVGPGPQAACCTLQSARCAACSLGTSIESYCATRSGDPGCKVVPAWLTGRVWSGITARIPNNIVIEGTQQKEQLGYTLLDRPVELNYGTSSQWIQANDGVRDPQNRDLGWPWGSIEGGHMVAQGLGGAVVPSQRLDAPVLAVERRRGRVRVLWRLARAAVLGARGPEPPVPATAARHVLSCTGRGQAVRERVGRDAAVLVRQRGTAGRPKQGPADAHARGDLFLFSPGPRVLFPFFFLSFSFMLPKRRIPGA